MNRLLAIGVLIAALGAAPFAGEENPEPASAAETPTPAVAEAPAEDTAGQAVQPTPTPHVIQRDNGGQGGAPAGLLEDPVFIGLLVLLTALVGFLAFRTLRRRASRKDDWEDDEDCDPGPRTAKLDPVSYRHRLESQAGARSFSAAADSPGRREIAEDIRRLLDEFKDPLDNAYQQLLQSIHIQFDDLGKKTGQEAAQIRKDLEAAKRELPAAADLEKAMDGLRAELAELRGAIEQQGLFQRRALWHQAAEANAEPLRLLERETARILGGADWEAVRRTPEKLLKFNQALEALLKRPGAANALRTESADFMRLLRARPWITLIRLHNAWAAADAFTARFRGGAQRDGEAFLDDLTAMAQQRESLARRVRPLVNEPPAETDRIKENGYMEPVMKALDAALREAADQAGELAEAAGGLDIHAMRIEPERTRFQEHKFTAQSREHRPDLEPGVVTKVIRPGYQRESGRVIRPAWVVVNAAPEEG